MSKILILITIFSMFLFTKPEKQIVGTWTQTDLEVNGLDSLAEHYHSIALPSVENKIIETQQEISKKEREALELTNEEELKKKYSELQELQKQLDEYIEEKETFTVKKVKIMITSLITEIIKIDYKMIINKDKTYTLEMNPKKVGSGKWDIENRKKLILTENTNKVTVYTIEEITQNKMILVYTLEEYEFSVDFKLTYEKYKN